MTPRLVHGYAGGEARPEETKPLPPDLGTWSWLLTQMTGNAFRKDLCVDCRETSSLPGRNVCKACHNARSLAYYHANRKTTKAERKTPCV